MTCSAKRSLSLTLLVGVSACMGPLVDDELIATSRILPAGAEVPEPSTELVNRIRANDGVSDRVARFSSFADGQRVWYWDLGPAPNLVVPVFQLVRRTPQGETEALEHEAIVGVVPGDRGYTPFWLMVEVEVTDDYDGEQLLSVDAIAEAQELGLTLAPVATSMVVNCPVVAPEVELEVAADTFVTPMDAFLYEGTRVPYFDFGVMAGSATNPATTPLYRLSRSGEPALSEPIRGVDMTGDGDTLDTNDIHGLGITDPDYTPACEVIEVTVPSGYASIDTSASELTADFQSASDLFDPDPVPGNVVAFEASGTLRNCPQQRAMGGL